MSTINSKNVQVGTSSTAAENFTLYQPATPDGTVRLGVGNTGATTLDAVTVTNAGNMTVSGSMTGSSLTVSGVVTVSAGSATAPSISPTGDSNTGVFFPAADTVALAANGGAKFTANSNGTLDVDAWKGNLSRDWDNYPTISVINNTAYGPQTEFRIHGTSGPSGGDFSVNLRVDGVFISGGQTLAYNVSDATAVTVNTATPTTIASCTITTTGKPVLLVSTGDGNPNQAGGWHYLQIYRGSTAIGKYIISENAGGNSANCPFALCFIDSGIGAGTYTYTTKANQGSGSFTYGETGNGQAPTILAVELI